MAITFERTKYSGRKQAFWRGEAKILPGGFKVENRINIGAVIKRGAFLQVNFGTMTAGIVKVGKVLAGGTTTKPRVEKNNYFEVGDKLMKVGGDARVTIDDIDHSNSEYDVLTLSGAVTGLTAGSFAVECTTEGDVAPRYKANAVVGADKEWKKNGSEAVDVAYEVLVIKSNIPAFPDEWVADGGFHLVTNPNIRFIEQ